VALQKPRTPPRSHSANNAVDSCREGDQGYKEVNAPGVSDAPGRAAESALQRSALRTSSGSTAKTTPTNSGRRAYYTASPRPGGILTPTSSSAHLTRGGTSIGEPISIASPKHTSIEPRYVLYGSDRGEDWGRDVNRSIRLLTTSGRRKHGYGGDGGSKKIDSTL